MIEIVCPSCQARYELPDDSIGPQGRKVSCSNCQHKWRAFPEAAAAEPAAKAAPVEAVAAQRASGPSPAEAAPATESAAPESPAQPPVGAGNRKEQLAAIRQMLSDLKDSATSDPEPEAKADAMAASIAARGFYRDSEAEERHDPLKARITQVDHLGRAVKGEPAQTSYDAVKLRRRHEKRAKRLQRARERRRKSGGFLTGFTLVAVVAGVMAGLYVMHPKIIAASPELEPAMTEYVTTIDRYRVELGEKTADWRAWLAQRVAKLSGGEEQKAPQ